MLWRRKAEKENGGPGTTAEEGKKGELDSETELPAFNAKLAALQTCDSNKAQIPTLKGKRGKLIMSLL